MRRALVRVCGDEWFEKGCPLEVRRRMLERQEVERAVDRSSTESDDLFGHATFADLADIIEFFAPLSDVLRPLAPSPERLCADLRTLEELRVKVADARAISYERFLWFDQKAKAGKYPNATKLANQFEISVKTAQRDIEFMRDRLSCPLVYDQGEKGYYYENDTFSLPSFYISSEELSALLITRNMLQGISAPYIGDELSLLIDKIASILKRHVVEEEIIDDAVSIQQVAYVPPPEGIFKAVLEGCLRRKRVEFSYCSPVSSQKTVRKVHPYHLFNYMGTKAPQGRRTPKPLAALLEHLRGARAQRAIELRQFVRLQRQQHPSDIQPATGH